jgi:hypothetical protein
MIQGLFVLGKPFRYSSLGAGTVQLDRTILLLSNGEAMRCSNISNDEVTEENLRQREAALVELQRHPLQLGSPKEVRQIEAMVTHGHVAKESVLLTIFPWFYQRGDNLSNTGIFPGSCFGHRTLYLHNL